MPNVLNEFAGDGVTQTFNFSMTDGYLSRDYVLFQTRPNDSILGYEDYDRSKITWLTDFSVRTAEPIPVGTTFVITRTTPASALVDFQNTSRIMERTLDTATRQSLHRTAETADYVSRGVVSMTGLAEAAVGASEEAAQAAELSAGRALSAEQAAYAAANSAQVAANNAGVAADLAEDAITTADEALQLIKDAVKGNVDSFNGREGTVLPEAGDYTPPQVGFALGGVLNGSPEWSSVPSWSSNDYGQNAATQALTNRTELLNKRLREVVSVKDFGAAGDGTGDDSAAFNSAFLYAHSIGGAVVTVPAGVYNIASRMHIGRNTELRSSEGVIYKRTGTVGFLTNDLGIDSNVTNYQGNGNIVIDGGVWDGNSVANYGAFNHMGIGQADGVVIKNCTFLDSVRAHCIDLSGCRNVWLTNNKFLGFSKYKHSPDGYGTTSDTLGEVTTTVTFLSDNQISGTSPGDGECVQFSSVTGNSGLVANKWYFVVGTNGSKFKLSLTFGGTPVTFPSGGSGKLKSWVRDFSEAVQLDHHIPGSFSFGALDGTPNVNVFFTGNVVSANPARTDNTFGPHTIGIGSHGGVHDKYMENIVVDGNSFIDCTFAGVRVWKWKGLVVSGNTFKNCVRCIHVTPTSWDSPSANNPDGTPSGAGQAGSDYIISGNIFNNYSDIGIFFTGPQSLAPNGQKVYHERVTISDNTFSSLSSQGASIDLRWVKDSVVSNNSFVDVERALALIYVSGTTINGNVSRNVAKEFIHQNDNMPTAGLGNSESLSIIGNHCTNTGYNCINLLAANNFSICNNVIVGTSTFAPTRSGISVSSGASNGIISGNAILDGGASNKPLYGIYVTATCTGVTLGPNKVQGVVSSEVQYGSVQPGHVVQGVTTIAGTLLSNSSEPGLLLKGFPSNRGGLAVPVGESLSLGHFNDTSKAFTLAAQVTADANWQIYGAGKGVVLKTPDGSKNYLVTVNNSGALVTTLT